MFENKGVSEFAASRKFNLQLFASDVVEEVVTPELTTEETETVETTETTEKVEVTEPKEGTKEFNFAEMRKKNKELASKIQEMESRQKQLDEYYTGLAKSKGRTDISTAEGYFNAIRQEELAAQYQETQDPLKLAQLIKESILSEIKQTQQSAQLHPDTALNDEISEFNKEYKQTLKNADEILDLPNSEKIIGYMEKGLSLAESYALANKDKLAAASKQAVVNQVKGVSHIKANPNTGSVDNVHISADEMTQWKQWFPGKTDEQCRKEITANKKLFVD